MGKLDDLKLWIKCKKEGRIEEYKQYKDQIESLSQDIIRYSNYLNKAKDNFIKVKHQFPKDSMEYIDARDEMYRWKVALDDRKGALKYVRPNSKEDIEYRDMQINSFAKKLQSVMSKKFNLKFHGTPIYFAEQIINSGRISSTAERYDGYVKSTDLMDEISVANRETIGRTIEFFSDVAAYNRSMPCGCVFAITPKDKNDANDKQSTMHTVDFKKNPEQLYGIFTSPENIKQVKSWMEKAGLNSSLVYTFEEFLKEVEEKSKILDKEFVPKVKIDSTIMENTKYDSKENNEIER